MERIDISFFLRNQSKERKKGKEKKCGKIKEEDKKERENIVKE